MAGVKLVPAEDMARRLQCALEARGDDDLLIIGRTDACATAGIDEAVRRGQCYLDAGVDMLFVDAVKRIDGGVEAVFCFVRHGASSGAF